MKNTNRDQKGFTLIELLVVIAIIGLLSTMAMYAYNLARIEARDARRKADLKQLVTAINLFFDESGSYPGEGPSSDISSAENNYWATTSGLVRDFAGHNMSEFLKRLPIDPINDATYYYIYEPHCASGSTKLGYHVGTILEKTGAGYYIREGIQNTSPCYGCDTCW